MVESGRSPLQHMLLLRDWLLIGALRFLFVEARAHSGNDAFLFKNRLVLCANKRIFLVVGNCGAAIANVDGTFIDGLFSRSSGLLRAVIVRSVPAQEAHGLFAHAEMRMEPVA